MGRVISRARVSKKNQIVVPKPVRAILNVNPGDTIVFILEGERIYIEKEAKKQNN